MKRLLVVLFVAFWVLYTPVAARSICYTTGMQKAATALADTVFFYSSIATSTGFEATYIYLELDEDASGPTYVTRWKGPRWGTISAVDDVSVLKLTPGQRRVLSGDGITAFSFVKTGASDELLYEASTCYQSWEWVSLVNTENTDSLVTLLSQPPPVLYTEQEMFDGLTMKNFIDGSSSNLRITRMTFPPTGGPCIDGAKAILVTLGWSDYDHGGFRIQPVYGATPSDTGNYYVSADTFYMSDTLGWWATDTIAANTSGTYSFWLNDVPGAGYLFLRLYPWGTANENYISGLSATVRVVQ